jgi:hypothetical protein
MKKAFITIVSTITIVFCGFLAEKSFPLILLGFELVSIIVLFSDKQLIVVKGIVILRVAAIIFTIYSFYPQEMFSELAFCVVGIYTSMILNTVLMGMHVLKIENVKKTLLISVFSVTIVVLSNIIYFESADEMYMSEDATLQRRKYSSIAEKFENQLPTESSILISKSDFATIPKDLYTLQNIETITFDGFSSSDISAEIKDLQKLTTLEITNDSSKSIGPNVFSNVGITKLSLKYCFYEKLPSEIANLVNLEEVELNFNRFSVIAKELWSLKKLMKVNLENNRLKSLDIDVVTAPLYEIGLSNNQLTELPKLTTIPTLTSFFIAFNKIRSIPENTRLSDHLNVLDLSSNELSTLPKTFVGSHLRYINLENNRFQNTPEAVYKCKIIQDILLKGNYISDFDPQKINDKFNFTSLSIPQENLAILKENAFNNFREISVFSDGTESVVFENKEVKIEKR